MLQNNKIETFNDIHKLVDKKLEDQIKEIPGQGSGISFTYLLMLSGSEDLVKPDRWIVRFLGSILEKKVNAEDCQLILKEVVNRMIHKGFTLTPQKLDHLIWNYQRINPSINTITINEIIQDGPMTIFDQIKDVMKSKGVGSLISSSEVKERLKTKFGINPTSVLPSDYCYNRYNNGIKFDKHIFEYCGRNKYKYLGENYLYSGLIYHKAQGEKKDKIIGKWIKGRKSILTNEN